MSKRLSMGLPGIEVSPGDHICALFRGEKGRDEILLPFLGEALLQGDKVIGVVDECPPRDLLEQVADRYDQVAIVDGQIDLFTCGETYLAGGGFVLDRMLKFWVEAVTKAVAEGRHRYVRSVGEMTWALCDAPGTEDLARYENELNRAIWRHPAQVSLCMYDLERFHDGGLIIGILHTHPKVLVGGAVVENPWYLPPKAPKECLTTPAPAAQSA